MQTAQRLQKDKDENGRDQVRWWRKAICRRNKIKDEIVLQEPCRNFHTKRSSKVKLFKNIKIHLSSKECPKHGLRKIN